jgi:Tfp pilus assembly protein FimV
MSPSGEEVGAYARQIVLHGVGGPGQTKLKAGSVLVVGAGGLGSPAAHLSRRARSRDARQAGSIGTPSRRLRTSAPAARANCETFRETFVLRRLCEASARHRRAGRQELHVAERQSATLTPAPRAEQAEGRQGAGGRGLGSPALVYFAESDLMSAACV